MNLRLLTSLVLALFLILPADAARIQVNGGGGAGVNCTGVAANLVYTATGSNTCVFSSVAGTGDVVGPASSVSGRVATFNGVTGKLIQDGGTLLSALAPKASPVFTGTVTSPITTTGTANPASAGQYRLANTDYIAWRDTLNATDQTLSLESGGDRFSFSNAILSRLDQNSVTRSLFRNTNAGSGASVRLSQSTDAGDFDISAVSIAGGATVSLQSASGFTGGMSVGTAGANPLSVQTNSVERMGISGAGVVSFPVTQPVKSGNYHLEPCVNNAGNSSTAQALDLSTCSVQQSTLTGNVTYTLSNPVTGGAYVIKIATGAGSFTVTWPGTVLWAGGSAPTITTTASKVDLVNLFWDGTNYYGSFSQNY